MKLITATSFKLCEKGN